jgi:hypothetical protein
MPLAGAAEKYRPGTSVIHERLKTDNEYMLMMTRLVSEVYFYFSFEVTDAFCSHDLDFC